MPIIPILSTLKRHKTATLLIILQVALSCAILCNAIFLVSQRVQRMQVKSGIDESHLVMIESINLDATTASKVKVKEDLDILRRVPGVQAATNVGQFPFASNSWQTGISLTKEQEKPDINANFVTASQDFQAVSGLKMKQGRWFTPDEFQSADLFSGEELKFPVTVITQALADRLFPGVNPIGKTVHGISSIGSRIIGISDNLLAPGGQPGDAETQFMTIFAPSESAMSWYVLRTDPKDRDAVLKNATEALRKSDDNRIFGGKRTLDEMRSRYFGRDRAVTWLLVVVSALLLSITAFGIGGLASFWVQQRTRQIGVRRALGATRTQILRYFQMENLLIVTGGVLLGMALAYGFNQFLMSKYELSRLPWYYLPAGAVLLWLLGQVAVWWPARRAASISPAIATRSV